MIQRVTWLIGAMSLFVRHAQGYDTSIYNLSCPSVNYYCSYPYGASKDNECNTLSYCKQCKACSPYSTIVRNCTWKTFTDNKICTCNYGYQGTSDGTTCTPCPACTSNAKQDAPCTACTCNAGYYMSSPDSTCQPCVSMPENAHLNNPCDGYTCNAGYFRVTQIGAVVHHICQKALVCSSNAFLADEGTIQQFCFCNMGYYSQPNTTFVSTRDSYGQMTTYQYRDNACLQCTDCGPFATSFGSCTSEGNTDVTCTCNAGYYRDYYGVTLSQPYCAPCPPGRFSPNPGATVCSLCPQGTYSTLTSCKTCDSGKYSDLKWNTCSDCDRGYVASSMGVTECTMCVAGTYSVRVACVSCVPGTYSQNASMLCSACSPGFYSYVPEASECDACQSGSYTSGWAALECLACNNGTYASNNASTCKLCTPGYFALEGQSTCTACNAGAYQSGHGASGCSECWPNYTYTPWHASTVCQLCTVCDLNSGIYYKSRCNGTQDATCQSCTTCQFGEYMASDCTEDSDRICPVCPPCPNGTYLKSGCINGLAPVCQQCSTCIGNVLAECTRIDDTVCSFNADCHARTSLFQVYSWMTDGSVPVSKFNGCTKGQYIADLNPLVCSDCPKWLYGPNGLWCEPCRGYTEPYVDQTTCVCITPSVIKSGDACECDIGFSVNYQGCQPCQAGTFKNFSVALQDNWWDQDVPCWPCPLGSWSVEQASTCFSCPPGQFRGSTSLQGCESCESGYYSPDATRSDSCVACNTSCDPGFYQSPCPMYPLLDRFVCLQCNALPANATWTLDCYYDCIPGFFKFNDTCVACSPEDCPIGFTRQPCTLYADVNCDVPCANETKPMFNSVWDKECAWKCEAGYISTALDYGMWTQYECIQESTTPFWLW